MSNEIKTAQAAIRAMDEERKYSDSMSGDFGFRKAGNASIAAIRALTSAKPVAWLRYRPDGTPDWAEDCIAENEHFLDSEMASDGYYLQPLFTTTPVVDVTEAMKERACRAMSACLLPASWVRPSDQAMKAMHVALTAALTGEGK